MSIALNPTEERPLTKNPINPHVSAAKEIARYGNFLTLAFPY
jgi:hypothetical protein